MTAFDMLISQSDAPSGSSAWTHLNSLNNAGITTIELAELMFDDNEIEVTVEPEIDITIEADVQIQISESVIDVEICE